ncbi:MAG: hypothetical protein B7Z24_02920 [Pseudomonadales bacterium 32-42-5]|nr:MAG: hypothetical protein B7Z24_02920 [Pseudomonadales bacterium 32-42-5]
MLIATLLVILVVFAFLRRVRATLIPGVAVPVSLLGTFGVMYLSGAMPNSPVHLVILTFVTMIQDLIRFCRYLIFATIILSWVVMFTQSRSPYIEVIQELAEPLLAPFRRLLPNMGMIDLSPIVAFLALYIAEMIMNEVAIVLLTGL